MLICTKCLRELTCVRTGVIAVWGEGHCYAGDEFKCSCCGNLTLNIDSTSFFSTPDELKTFPNVLCMTKKDLI